MKFIKLKIKNELHGDVEFDNISVYFFYVYYVI